MVGWRWSAAGRLGQGLINLDANRKFFPSDGLSCTYQCGAVVILDPVFDKAVGGFKEKAFFIQAGRGQVPEPGVEDLWINLILQDGQNSVPELLGFHFTLISETLEYRCGSPRDGDLLTGYSTGVEKPASSLKTSSYIINLQ